MGVAVIAAVLGSLGGIVTFTGAVWVVVRAIFRQSSATRDNTEALGELNATVKDLNREFHRLAERVARLEGSSRANHPR